MYIELTMSSRIGKRTENLTVKVSEELKEEIEGIAGEEARTVSNVAYLLIERGLDSYRLDGRLVAIRQDKEELITVPSFGRADADLKNGNTGGSSHPQSRTTRSKPKES